MIYVWWKRFFSRLTKGLFGAAIPLGTLQIGNVSSNAVYWPPWGHHSPLPLSPFDTYGLASAVLVPLIITYAAMNIGSAIVKKPKDQGIKETLKYMLNPFYDVKVEIVDDKIVREEPKPEKNYIY